MVLFDKKTYEPLRNDFKYQWYKNKMSDTYKIFTGTFAFMFLLFIIIFGLLLYPYIIIILFTTTVNLLVILVFYFKNYQVPKRVGIFSKGIVIDYRGKYEYVYWHDIDYYNESTILGSVGLTFKKRDGSNYTMVYIDSDINVMIIGLLKQMRISSRSQRMVNYEDRYPPV
jgi:hypothetical protein